MGQLDPRVVSFSGRLVSMQIIESVQLDQDSISRDATDIAKFQASAGLQQAPINYQAKIHLNNIEKRKCMRDDCDNELATLLANMPNFSGLLVMDSMCWPRNAEANHRYRSELMLHEVLSSNAFMLTFYGMQVGRWLEKLRKAQLRPIFSSVTQQVCLIPRCRQKIRYGGSLFFTRAWENVQHSRASHKD